MLSVITKVPAVQNRVANSLKSEPSYWVSISKAIVPAYSVVCILRSTCNGQMLVVYVMITALLRVR